MDGSSHHWWSVNPRMSTIWRCDPACIQAYGCHQDRTLTTHVKFQAHYCIVQVSYRAFPVHPLGGRCNLECILAYGCDQNRTLIPHVKFQVDQRHAACSLLTQQLMFHGEALSSGGRHGHALRLLRSILITFVHPCLEYIQAKFQLFRYYPV